MVAQPSTAIVRPPRATSRAGALDVTGGRWWTAVLLAVVAALSAVIAGRISGPNGPWLWNLDMPKLDYPLAVFFHDALRAGHLPLWNDQLSFGFPLYAEGQIGAFYPPNWLIFQLPPLQALDLTRFLHLSIAGLGLGLLALRLTGSRAGAAVATATVVLCGGIVTKLEWTNVVVAWAWAPWVLYPLVRRPAPTRRGLVAAGVIWGIQALAGHPNTWVLTGIAAVTIMLVVAPRPATLGRIVGFGLVGAAVGAVQLIPTAVLLTLSPRASGISASDLFNDSATPFDLLGLAFANVFSPTQQGAWNLGATWHPQGFFGVLEAGMYVGMPVMGLAAVGARARRARPYLALAAVGVAIPILGAFHPGIWADLPVINGLRHPDRAYMLLDLALAILAAIGVARLTRSRGAWRRVALAVVVPVAAYGAVLAFAANLPATFEGALQDFGYLVGPAQAVTMRTDALVAMGQLAPFVPEVLIGCAGVALAVVGGRVQRRSTVRALVAATAVVPLVLFSPAPNGVNGLSAFSYADAPFVKAVQAAAPHHLLTLGEPGWYPGVPDQLAAAGVPDVRMFSSLDLEATDETVSALRQPGADPALRRALGVDVVATFGGASCPGTVLARVQADDATICRDAAALTPPYWVPAGVVAPVISAPPGLPLIQPVNATIDAQSALADARSADVVRWDSQSDTVTIDAPEQGWLVLGRAWWPMWQTTVDGSPVQVSSVLGIQAIQVPAGRHTIRQSLVPLDARAGLALGLLGLLLAGVWIRSERWTRDRVRTPTDPARRTS